MAIRKTDPLTWLGIALVVAIGTMVVLGAWGMTAYSGYYGMMGNGSWVWGLVMMAVPGIFLVLILVVVLGDLAKGTSASAPVPASDPIAILDARYARGELSREEFLRAREDLRTGRTSS